MHTHRLLSLSAYLISTSATAINADRYRVRSNQQPIVGLSGNVTIRGNTTAEVESFLNVRFGSDTGGVNRFAHPTPYTYKANSIIDASRSGAACPQPKVPTPGFAIFDNVTNVSEDCLTLRVDRPAGTTKDAKLPVMVYIYGGGDFIGQIYDGAYDPSKLVSSAKQKGYPVIYAAMNYRLGIFGFAASPALATADSLNAGLLDQRLGLEWIQKNIAAFGGDPARVTIFGESAGATAVGLQITAYGGQVKNTPFQRAIMQSGGPTANSGVASNSSALTTSAIANITNCTSSTSEQELSCLRSLPLSTLLESTISYARQQSPPWGFGVFNPTSPSPFIPENPSTLLRTGKFVRDIDIITGWNEDDGSLFTPPTIDSDAAVAGFLSSSYPGMTNASIQQALDLYPLFEFPTNASSKVSAQFFRASRMLRDSEFACASVLMSQANNNFSTCETGNYIFALNQTVFAASLQALGVGYEGVIHLSDVPYVFDQATTRYAKVSTASDKALSSGMSGSWAAFATYGNVSGRAGALEDWPASTNLTTDIRIIGGPKAGVRKVGEYERLVQRCGFWNSPKILTQQLQT